VISEKFFVESQSAIKKTLSIKFKISPLFCVMGYWEK